MIDLDRKTVSWTQEIYLDFRYYKDDENFHSFEADTGMIGILFVDSNEAEEFYQTVLECTDGYTSAEKLPSKSKSKSKSKSILGVFGFGKKSRSNKNDDDSSTTEDSDTSSVDTETKKKERKKQKDSDLTHEDVSEPRDFTHLSHIGFNPEKGTFDIQNIPPEWKTLFSKAGITQDQLENKSTAKFIAGFVQDSEPQMNEILKKQKGKPPVPVPLKKKAAPPPPSMKKAPTSPLKSQGSAPMRSSAPPPPPPKKKSIAKTSAPIPTPPPKSVSVLESVSKPPPPPVAASSNHSALFESIRGAGIGILKPVKDSRDISAPSSPTTADPHSALMASIKGGANLKPAQKVDRSLSSPTSSVSSTDPTDMMAAMLAKALAARNKKLSADSSDEDEDSDDSRW